MEVIKLEVRISAEPVPDIVWYRNDVELYHCDRHRVMFDDLEKKYGLVIMDAFAEDSGKYRCVARNRVGIAESACVITVQGNPRTP
jgi:hypothetical protein